MLDRLKNVFKRNKKELQEIEQKKGLKHFSKSGIDDRKGIIARANNLIEDLDSTTREYEESQKANNYQKTKLCEDRKKYLEYIVKLNSQGKVRDIISSFFFQIDKRIHNFLFNQENNRSDRLWDRHCFKVINKYEDLPGYIIKNGFVILLLSGASAFLGQVGGLSQSFSNIVSTIMTCANVAVTSNLSVNIASVLYNKTKYNEPYLRRKAFIYSGNYFENILNSVYSLTKSKELAGEIPIFEEPMDCTMFPSVKKKETEPVRTMTEELVVEETLPLQEEEIVKESKEEELVAPNIQNYGNIEVGYMAPLSKYHTEEGKISYSKAVSYARRIDSQNASENELEDKLAAYEKLYQTYGKSKPRKKKTETQEKKLSDYNQTLKLLAFYGRKVHEKTASPKEYNTYMGLLYHLGKDDDFITDYLSDEYDRYMADKEEYEKKLQKRI